MKDIIFKNFEEAGQTVLKFLSQKFGFNLWMITRTEGDNWIVLQSEDKGYNVIPGQVFSWADSFCSHMVLGKAPKIAPRSEEIPLYLNAPIAKKIDIKAYIGQPLIKEDGTLFGTLCAIDPNPQSESLLQEEELFNLFGKILSYILQVELRENEQKRQKEFFEAVALSDSLTGLFNRRGWDQLLAQEEARCKSYGHPAAIFMIDLNNLKIVNDQFGHFIGDELIKKTANLLKICVRNNDIVARIGGDEFAILSIENTKEGAELLFDRIQEIFANANISIAVGFAIRNPSYSLLEAVQEADEKMYENKRMIKN
ncbi:sensor domain-containing diguanylate cyclase [Acinetobacter bereziniae]|uniref:sensor domain-containing diguanylate cyclase n=1 Tax=Acinetobacter bereziniae TaxID=106648 RepID=UPI0021D1DD22|nr:sensor domain-containing diguanylate cyclase [Acinetobacter bereziniae]MCU4418968.1 sensor domain-containing diguanylate cyclase [Acinetobacter bereziniae]